MRALFTTQPGSGHWRVLAPFARGLQAIGAEIRFATVPWFQKSIQAEGFECVAVGNEHHWSVANSLSTLSDSSELPNQSTSVWTELFVRHRARDTLPDLVRVCESWQPDLIVRDLTEFGGYLAGESLGIPHATVQVGAYRPELHRLVAPELDALRRSVGLPPDPDLTRLFRYLLLSPVPPTFQAWPDALPPTAHHVQFVPFDAIRGESVPLWLDSLCRDRPTVCATLGTAYNKSIGLFERIIETFREERVNLILMTGDQDDVISENVPKHVHVEPYIPFSRVFRYCDAVVCHGGFSTVLTAIRFGVPMVIVPIAADQPDNALRCAQLEMAVMLAPDSLTRTSIRDSVQEVLHAPTYRINVASLQRQMRSQPGVESAVTLLTRLARERQPLVGA